MVLAWMHVRNIKEANDVTVYLWVHLRYEVSDWCWLPEKTMWTFVFLTHTRTSQVVFFVGISGMGSVWVKGGSHIWGVFHLWRMHVLLHLSSAVIGCHDGAIYVAPKWAMHQRGPIPQSKNLLSAYDHLLRYHRSNLKFFVASNTPPKTNMEPENGGLEDDFPFQTGDFPC